MLLFIIPSQKPKRQPITRGRRAAIRSEPCQEAAPCVKGSRPGGCQLAPSATWTLSFTNPQHLPPPHIAPFVVAKTSCLHSKHRTRPGVCDDVCNGGTWELSNLARSECIETPEGPRPQMLQQRRDETGVSLRGVVRCRDAVYQARSSQTG